MSKRLLTCLLLVLALVGTHVAAAPYKPPPRTGSGVLVQRSFTPDEQVQAAPLALFAEPGVSRIGEFPPLALPDLTPAVPPRRDERYLAVYGKRGEWLQVVYDDAGRTGWLERPRAWRYLPWREFLRGRQVRVLGGLKQDAYRIHTEPRGDAPALDVQVKDRNLRLVEAEEGWALVIVGTEASGWLRWRDADGRFRIVVDPGFDPQKD